MNRENLNAPTNDERDEFYQWVMSFAEGAPETTFTNEQGNSIE